MSDVIKMHEERQTTQGYNNMFPGSNPPPPSYSPGQPCQTSAQHCHHLSQHCLQNPQFPCSYHFPQYRPISNCCYQIRNSDLSTSEHLQNAEKMKVLEAAIEKLKEEIVDIVNTIEKLNTDRILPSGSPPVVTKPLFQNPHDIPNFDNMEDVTEVEDGANDDNDESVVSMEEFVPDISDHLPHALATSTSTSLN